MSDTAFNKEHFQQELADKLEDLLAGETAINSGQLHNFLKYIQSQNEDKYSDAALLAVLADVNYMRAMRLVMVYTTMALTIQDQTIFNAALEVFPVAEIKNECTAFILDVLDHIRDLPENEVHTYFNEGLTDGLHGLRLGQVRALLSGRFADTL